MNHLPWFVEFILFIVPTVFAVSSQSLSISGIPSTLDEHAESDILVSFTCPNCSTDSYLRGVFYPSGTSYFGYTQANDKSWSNQPASGCTSYWKVAASDMSPEGTWSGILRVKLDSESPYYQGPGEYLFKVGRYTPSCSSASVWSQEVTVAITGPTITPTPNPTSSPKPTATGTGVPVPTVTASPVPSATFGPTEYPTGEDVPAILGINDIFEPDASPTATEQSIFPASVSGGAVGGLSPFVLSFLCIGSGLGLLATATSVRQVDVWKKLIKSKKNTV